MAALQEVIRKISIVANAVGLAEMAAALDRLAGSQAKVAVASETTEKATLSMQSKLNSLRLSLDAEYRSEEKLAAIQKTVTAARQQGLVTMAEQNRLLDLAAVKYKVAGESAEFMARGIDVAKEASMGLIATLGPLAGLALVAELPAKIMEAVKSGAEIKNMAETIGIAADKLQELDYAAKLTDVSTDTMNSALEKFSKNLGIAATGTGELSKILKANHVVITGDLMKDFENYANLVQHATNAEQKNLLVTTAFGKNAQEMGRIFNDGADGVKRLGDEAQNTGIILGDDTLFKAEELNKEFVKMQAQLGTVFADFFINAGPSMLSFLGQIEALAKQIVADLNAMQSGDWSKFKDPLSSPAPPGAKLDPFQTWINQTFAGGKGGLGDGPLNMPKLLAQSQLRPGDRGSIPGPFDPIGSMPSLKEFQAFANSGTPATISPKTSAPETPIERVTAALKLQQQALTETNKQAFISQQLSQAKVTDSSKEGKALEKLAGDYYDQKAAIDAANQAAQFMGQTIETAFEGILDGSTSVVDAMKNVAKAIGEAALQSLILGQGPLAGIFGTAPTTAGGGLGGLLGQIFKPHALGGVHQSPSLHAYANQIVDSPTLFKFAQGGVMGEAGPEAIMPLKRGADGKLGVAANQNAGQVTNIFNIDAKGAEIGVEQKIVLAIRSLVPGMIQSGAPSALVAAQRDNLLKRA